MKEKSIPSGIETSRAVKRLIRSQLKYTEPTTIVGNGKNNTIPRFNSFYPGNYVELLIDGNQLIYENVVPR